MRRTLSTALALALLAVWVFSGWPSSGVFSPRVERAGAAVLVNHWDANDINGDGVENTGDICNNGSTTWTRISGSNNGTLSNFASPCDGSSGWDGDGSTGDPYRLQFDGTNDSVSLGTFSDIWSYSIWFKSDAGATGTDYIFAAPSIVAYAYVLNGTTLVTSYNGGGFLEGTGIEPDTWYHLVITSNNTTTTYYLNGVQFASQALAGETSNTQLHYLGWGSASNYFDGAIAEFRVYSDGLTASDVQTLYEGEKWRFATEPAGVQIERVTPSAGTGGTTVTLQGWNFTGATSVSFGGSNGTSLSVASDGKLSVTAPAHAAGFVDVTVTTPGGSFTATGAFLYTDSPTDTALWLDASNIDTIGGAGDGETDQAWKGVTGRDGGLIDISQPTNGSSGWDGDGSTGDPYRLQFDGTNDSVSLGPYSDIWSYSIWFKSDAGATGTDYIFAAPSISAYAYVLNGNMLITRYNAGQEKSTGIDPDTWYHLVITSNNTTTTYYLNGVQFASQTWAGETSNNQLHYLGWGSASNYFDGAIAEFRMYYDGLTEGEVQAIYEEQKWRFASEPASVRIERIFPSAGTGGTTVTLQGWDFTGTTAVSFDGSNGTNVSVASNGKLTVTAPEHAAGFVDVTVTTPGGSFTATGAFLYTDSPTDTALWLDASNIDTIGGAGDGETDVAWKGVTGRDGGLIDISQPTNGSSGWDGDGSTGDPYRLQFDGTNDSVSLGPYSDIWSYSIWFKSDAGATGTDQILYGVSGQAEIYVTNGTTLTAQYNNGTLQSTTIDADTWYHLVMTSNNTTTTYYLNGTSFASQTLAGETSNDTLHHLGYNGWSNYFDGAIAEFRMYYDGLTQTEVTTMYNEEKSRFPTQSVVDISGVCKAFDRTTNCGDTGTIRVARNGSLQAQTQATVAGTWTVSDVTLNTGDIVTVFIDGASDADEAVAVTQYDGAGDITGMVLYKEHLTIGSDDDPVIDNNDLGLYDNSASADEDIFHEGGGSLNANTLNGSENATFLVLNGTTMQPGGALLVKHLDVDGTLALGSHTGTVVGDWDTADGVFTSNGRVNLMGSGATLNAASAFHDVRLTAGSLPSPLNIDDLAVWLDADDESTITENGNGVATWEDKSGNANDATAGNTGSEPDYALNSVNGRNTVRFSSTEGMKIDYSLSSTPYTVFIVYHTSVGGGGARRAIQGASNWLLGPYGGDHTHYANGWVTSTGPTAVNDALVVAEAVNNGSASTFYVNGVDETDSPSPVGTPGLLYLGGYISNGVGGAYNEPLQGDIAEVLVYTAALTESERETIECYLGAKWGITVSGCSNFVVNHDVSYVLASALDANGDLSIGQNASLDVSGTNYGVTVGGDWTNENGDAGFAKRSGTVTLDGTNQTLSGTTVFHNLSKTVTSDATLSLDVGDVFSVGNSLTLRGASSNLLSLRSTDDGTAARLVLESGGTQTIDYLDVQDIDASGGEELVCDAATEGCMNGGNNTNWNFAGSGPVTVTGTVYADEGSTALTNRTVALSVSGSAILDTTDTDGGGQFTLSGAAMRSGEAITLFLDGETENAVTVTIAGGSSMTGVHLYRDRLIVRNYTGGMITNAHLATGDNAEDGDFRTILRSASASTGTVVATGKELLIWTGTTYKPGGYVTAGDWDINGTLTLGTHTGTVVGNWDATGGSFTTSGVVKLTGSGGKTITSNGSSFHHLDIVGSQPFGGMVGWWKLDEGAGTNTADATGNGYAGTLTGGPTWSTDTAPLSYADPNPYSVDLDGSDDYINVSSSTALASNPISISFWTKNDEATAQYHGIMGKTNSTNWTQGWGFFYNSSSAVHFFIEGYNTNFASSTISPQQWNHVVGTWNGSTIQVYVNDTAGTSDTYASTMTATHPLEFGRLGSNTYNINGKLDDVRIFNRTLSTGEISSLYRGPGALSGTYTLAGALDVNGNLTMRRGSELDVSATNYAITLGGNWTNQTGTGGFIKRSGTVTLDGSSQTLSGTTLFHTLSKTVSSAATLSLDVGDVFSVGNSLTLRGASSNLLSLRSTDDGTAARLVLESGGTQTIDYLDVQDIDASGGEELECLTATEGCVNSENNTNWNFGSDLPEDWYDGDWGFRREITVDPAKVAGSSNLADYPLLVRLSGATLEHTGNGGNMGQTDGGDIVFTADDGTTKLDHEIEYYNSTDGTIVAWVQVPTLYTGTGTSVYMYYGNASVADQEDPSAVWDDGHYVSVWHMADDPSTAADGDCGGGSDEFCDATSNNNDGDSFGTMTTGDFVNGQIFKGYDLDGSDDYLLAPGAFSSTSTVTLSGWFSADTLGAYDGLLGTSGIYGNLLLSGASGNPLTYMWAGSADEYNGATSLTVPTTGEMVFGAVVVTSTNATVYLKTDAAQNSWTNTKSHTAKAAGAGDIWYIGNDRGSTSRSLDGIVDELRVEKTNRSADWLETRWYNENDPLTFYSVGNEEEPGEGGGSTGGGGGNFFQFLFFD